MHKISAFFISVFCVIPAAQAQLNISYQDAVARALKNNYDIRITEKNATIAEMQNTYGNAGFLPKVDVNATTTGANNDTKQDFASGLTVDQKDVRSTNINAGVFLTWTIFDGLKMFATKNRLDLLSEQGKLVLKMQIENTIEEVTVQYYQIVKQLQLIKGIDAAMRVTDERILLAERKLSIGSGSNVEVLQAKLDWNAQKSNLISQENLLTEYRNNLLLLLKMPVNTEFTADTAFSFESIRSIDDINASIVSGNTSLMILLKTRDISRQSIAELRGQMFPKIGLNTSYVFARTSNAAGFSLFNQNLGYNWGLSFAWNLFNGGITRTQVKTARTQYDIAVLQQEQQEQKLFTDAYIAYKRWQGNMEIQRLEEENIRLAEENLKITTERMKLGLGNYLEVRESQSSFEEAITRLVNARFSLKQSEIALRKLRGELVQ